MDKIDRLKKLIEDKFSGSQVNFAKAIGKAPAQVNQWLNGYRNIGTGLAFHIESSLGLPLGWLDGNEKKNNNIKSNATFLGAIEPWDSDTPLDDDEVEVPFFKDVHLSAGNGNFDDIVDHNGRKLRFSLSTLRSKNIDPKNVVCVSADGDSMYPMFSDGATLGIDTGAKTIRDGRIYAFNHGGLLRTKMLLRLPDNKIKIRSFNSELFPEETVDVNDLNVIGRIFWTSELL